MGGLCADRIDPANTAPAPLAAAGTVWRNVTDRLGDLCSLKAAMQEDAPIDWEPDVPARRRCEQTGTDPAKAVKACERFAGVPGASVKACEKDFCKLGGADLVNLQEDVLIERLRDDDPKLPATVTCPEGYTPRVAAVTNASEQLKAIKSFLNSTAGKKIVAEEDSRVADTTAASDET